MCFLCFGFTVHLFSEFLWGSGSRAASSKLYKESADPLHGCKMIIYYSFKIVGIFNKRVGFSWLWKLNTLTVGFGT